MDTIVLIAIFADVCRSIGGLVHKTFGTCVADEREDNTNVIFFRYNIK